MPQAPTTAVDRVFAESLFALGLKHQCLDRLFEDFQSFVAALAALPKLKVYLEVPVIHHQHKRAFLERAFAARVHRMFLNFLQVVLLKRRAVRLATIFRAFEAMVDHHHHRTTAEVTTAVPMDEATRAFVERLLGERLHATAKIAARVNPALLGGMTVLHGDRFLDGSLLTRLRRLRRQLMRSKIHEFSQ